MTRVEDSTRSIVENRECTGTYFDGGVNIMIRCSEGLRVADEEIPFHNFISIHFIEFSQKIKKIFSSKNCIK